MAKNRYDSANAEAELVLATPDPNGVWDFRVTKVEWNEGKDGKEGFLSVGFRQEKTGALASYSEFPVNESWYDDTKVLVNKKGEEDKKKRTALDKAYDDQSVRLKHIFGAISGIDYDAHPVSGRTFEEYGKNYIATLDMDKVKKETFVHWLNLRYKTNQTTGKVNVTLPVFPPLLSTNYKPRKWEPTAYDIKERVFFRPTGNAVQENADQQADDEVAAQAGGSLTYSDDVDNGTGVEEEDEDSLLS